MANFLDTQSDAQRFAALLADYDRRLQALERTTQAGHTSIEGGALDIYDDEGVHRGSVGVQPDGTVAVVPVNAPPPPTPTQPVISPVLAGLVVGWDGQWDDSYDTPLDFARMQVHVGTAADFTPSLATMVAAIGNRAGGTVTVAVEGYTPVWVRLVAVNTAAVLSPPSTAVQATPRQAVGQDLIDGIVTELKLAQGAVTAAKVAAGAIDAAALAQNAVTAEKVATAAITAAKLAAGSVNLNALGGALADTASQRYVDAMADASAWRTLANGVGAKWEHRAGVDAPTGGTVGQATGYVRLRGTIQIPYDPGVLYRISARIRATAQPATGPDTAYVGVLGIGADGVRLVNRSGEDSQSMHYYAAAAGAAVPAASGWITYVGYLRGRAAAGATGSAGPNPDPRSPGLVHDQVRFITPYVWLNFASQNTANSPAVQQVDAVTIEALKTGLVDSTNFVAGSVTTAALATDSVTAGKVAADAISAREIIAEAITAAELAAGAVTAGKVAAGAVTADSIAASSIKALHLVAGAVEAASLAADAVVAGKIAAEAITARELKALSVTADKIAANSITASKIAAGAIDAERLSIGTGNNLLPDPSFEGSATAILVEAAGPPWSVVSGGNGSAKALKVDAVAAAATSRSLTLTTRPILPGEQLHLATDYQCSPDFAGAAVRLYARWLDAAGGPLAEDAAQTTNPVLGPTWQRVTATVTAPPDTAKVQIVAGITDATAGSVLWDNAVARPVLSGVEIADGAITAAKIRAGSISAEHLTMGTNGNLVPDPSFETGYMARDLTSPTVQVKPGGNNSANALWLDATMGPGLYRYLRYALVPVAAGERYWLAGDYKVSTDWVGASVRLVLRWYDGAKQVIGDSHIAVTAPPPDGTWKRTTGTVTAPTGAVYGALELRTTNGTSSAGAGSAWFDNLEWRPVLSSAVAGARAEISPAGLRLFDADGEEAVALVTGRPNYLTLSTDGVPVATIDDQGNAGFSDLAVAGQLTVGGDTIGTHLSQAARGLVAVDYQDTTVTASTTDYGYVELSFEADTNRMYRVVLDVYAQPSAAGGELVMALKDGGASAPSIGSPQIQSVIFPMPTSGLRRVHMETIRSGAQFGAGLHRLLTTFRCSGGPSGQTVSLKGATGWPGLMYIEDVGPAIPKTGLYNTGGGSSTPPKKTYTKEYAASWSGSYASRSTYNSYYGNKCLQGYISSTNGMQAALIGFPSALATDLSGAVINKAEVYLYFEHWYNASGGTAVIKAHKHASRPATFSCDPEAQSIGWSRNQGKWVDITGVFDSTSWRGIALDPNNSSATYYGRARGVGETYPPRLRVTFTK
ncbi:hypothetical protein ACPCSC_30400 [Streptomyces lavendulocolor]|uniref:hypothetical protein n=1 Tax=Streptomyces lavendulocolor TaxID=67316 RepID=UPI003C307207